MGPAFDLETILQAAFSDGARRPYSVTLDSTWHRPGVRAAVVARNKDNVLVMVTLDDLLQAVTDLKSRLNQMPLSRREVALLFTAVRGLII